jgi:hypothetical protein
LFHALYQVEAWIDAKQFSNVTDLRQLKRTPARVLRDLDSEHEGLIIELALRDPYLDPTISET